MSQTEQYKGILTPTGKTLSEYRPDIDDIDDLDETEVLIDGKVYTVERTAYEDYDDIFEAERLSDGKISFHVKYYNGGCGFSEAIDESIKNMKCNADKLDEAQ